MENLDRNHSEGTILYVDDDGLLRQMMGRVINAQYPRFRVVVAENGYEALAKMDECRPDLIILDYRMPVLDGYQLSKKMLARNAGSRIIILSGYLDHHIRQEFTSIGITTFIEKPFEREELYRVVNRFICHDQFPAQPPL